MRFISSGDSELDVLLGGGFVRNASVLFLTEAGSMGEIVALHLFTNRLAMGDSGFIIDLDIPPKRIREWFKFKKFDINEFERNERFFLIDGFTRMYGEGTSHEKYVIDKPRDIVHVNAYMAKLSEIIEPHKPRALTLMFSNNLFLFRRHALSKAINFFYKTRMALSQFGLCVFVLDKGMVDEKSLQILEHASDYVLDLRVTEKDRRFQKYLRVVKSPSPNYLDDYVPYEIRPAGFALSTETVEEFDRLKEQVKMLEEGVLEILGTRVVILDSNFSPMLFEVMIEELGYERASEIMYERGKRGNPLFREFIKQFKITNIWKVIESFTKFSELRGHGRYEVTFDEGIEGFRFTLFNSPFCSYLRGLGRTAGWITAGIIASCFEEYTGDRYECREEKCVAKGDDWCEFVVKPSRI